MRGRQPPGPEFVQRLEGSVASKQRAEAILQTLTQQVSINQASAALGITPQRFHELRQQAVQALVDSLEAQPVGRPRKEATASPEVAALQAEVARLRQELLVAQARAEIAVVLPGRQGAQAARKKKRPPRKRSP
jgi:hypothetical protein